MTATAPAPRRRYSLDSLLDVLGAVARVADPGDPASVSTRAYNAAIAGSPYPDAPTANATLMRFNRKRPLRLAWREIVELALREPDKRTPLITAATREEEAPWLDERHVFFALNRVARAEEVGELSPAVYAQARERLLARERRNGRGEIAELLPTVGQVERICGDWQGALKVAGLAVPAKRAPSRRTTLFAADSVGCAEAAAIFAAVNDRFPSYRTLALFARECGFQLADKKHGGSWAGQLKTAGALLADAGLPVPEAHPRSAGRRRRPDFQVPVEGVPGAPKPSWRPPASEITRERAIEALRAFDREQPASAKRGVREFQAWQRGGEWPGLSTIQRVGRFSELKAEAIKLNREQGKTQHVQQQEQQQQQQQEEEVRRDRQRDDDHHHDHADHDRADAVDHDHERAAELDHDDHYPARTFEIGPALRRAAAAPTRTVSTGPPARPYRGPRPWVSDLAEVGLLDSDETLVATHEGQRYTATFDTDAVITVAGLGTALTLSEARALVRGSRTDGGGWSYWKVERHGELVPLSRLREQWRELRTYSGWTPRAPRR